jgi:predicted ATP-dependent serine protease
VRLREAAKLGFTSAVVPAAPGSGRPPLRTREIGRLLELVEFLGAEAPEPTPQ